MDLKKKIQEAYGRNRGYAHGFASPHAPSLGGPRHREDDEYHVPDPVAKDVPHAVHVNGKKWKSFGSQSHAQNVAKKIKGATVHKEDVDLGEGYNDIGRAYGGAGSGRSADAMETARLTRHAKAAAKKAGVTFNTSAEYRGWHAKQKPKKTVKEAKDAREYDYEGDMAKSQLRSIIANAQRAHDMLEDNTNMAEWVQSKITLAADYISTVADYMQAEVNEAATAGQQAAIAINMKKKGIKPKNEEVVLESHEKAAKEIHGALFHNAIPPGSESHFVNSVLKSHGLTPADKGKVVDQVHKMGYTGNKLKEDTNMETRIWEAWSMGKRDPQKGIKVGHQVRSYDFPGMHDDHYIEGHVVGETPHSYHIRTSKVVRGGKEVPIPAHMGHVEAPKGKGMFSDAYAVHKIVAKQDSVAAQPEPAKGGARTFANIRGK